MDNEKDKFIEIVREKLTNYTLPVDDDSWDKIAERLNPAPQKNIRRLWIAAIAVAACILLLFLLFPVEKITTNKETASQLYDNQENIIHKTPKNETEQSNSAPDVGNKKFCGKIQSGKPIKYYEIPVEENIGETQIEDLPTLPAKKEEPKVAGNHPVSPVSDFNFDEDEQTPVIKHKKRQSLSFSFGSGANLLAENTATAPQNAPNTSRFYLNSNLTSSQNMGQSKDISSYENYPKVTYQLPLSFGVTIQKELNRTFALESGIVYTFLSTSFAGKSFPRSSAELQLHYLGIPLNLHTRIFGNRVSPWEMYLSTGGMVEKGILSHWTQKTYYNDTINSSTSNERIKGLQWSVSISPGVDYRIYKKYSIYLEPKLSYYFDNNQPVSVRTNHPLVVGINAGIRYTW